MEKIDILKQIDFGQRIAEEESDQLLKYFMSTDPYKRVLNGEVDVIYGPKGSGKSAIYSVIESESESLFERQILIISAENPRGSTAFAGLTNDPPTSEIDFINLWKLYFIIITHAVLKKWDLADRHRAVITRVLEEPQIVTSKSLRTIPTTCFNYIKQLSRVESIQPGVDLNELSRMPKGVFFK